FLKNFPRLFSGNYSNKNTNTIKPLKNQHSTQPTHATRRHHTNNHTQLDSRVCLRIWRFWEQTWDKRNKNRIKETKKQEPR
ncbi:hypothetical protein, partial [Gardnerella vaginalis]|uniref:hypothetical protein n=1 Tax=Gardnerella vaginalis TaxID=2702 RepID=UPI001C7217A0